MNLKDAARRTADVLDSAVAKVEDVPDTQTQVELLVAIAERWVQLTEVLKPIEQEPERLFPADTASDTIAIIPDQVHTPLIGFGRGYGECEED